MLEMKDRRSFIQRVRVLSLLKGSTSTGEEARWQEGGSSKASYSLRGTSGTGAGGKILLREARSSGVGLRWRLER
jgi:hypothetical protein